MEIFKNVATVVGCFSACIALLMTIFKPIRSWVIVTITNKQKETETTKKLNQVLEDVNMLKEELNTRFSELDTRVESLEQNVLENEAQRLKSELFSCGNRCRRGITLHAEEFEHMRQVHERYSKVLHQNHDGTQEWNFIYDYYNSQTK